MRITKRGHLQGRARWRPRIAQRGAGLMRLVARLLDPSAGSSRPGAGKGPSRPPTLATLDRRRPARPSARLIERVGSGFAGRLLRPPPRVDDRRWRAVGEDRSSTCSNAFEYTSAGEITKVQRSSARTHVELIVSDRRAAASPSHEAGRTCSSGVHRVEAPGGPPSRGTGIGPFAGEEVREPYIARGVAVFSRTGAPGAGSTFQVRIPTDDATIAQSAWADARPTAARAGLVINVPSTCRGGHVAPGKQKPRGGRAQRDRRAISTRFRARLARISRHGVPGQEAQPTEAARGA